jgi:hypothetical protein
MTLKEFAPQELRSLIDRLPHVSTSQLVDIENAINAVQRQRRLAMESEAINDLKVGDVVSFNARTRGIKHGRIVKFLPRNVVVEVAGNMVPVRWRVSPSLLRKVMDPKRIEQVKADLKKLVSLPLRSGIVDRFNDGIPADVDSIRFSHRADNIDSQPDFETPPERA